MGGRGGGSSIASKSAASSAASPSPAASLANDPEREYRQWFSNPRDISADFLDTGQQNVDVTKVILVLPDRNARISWDGQNMVVRDNETDQLLPFKGKTHRTVYGQISRYYGRRVEHTNRLGNVVHFGENVQDLRGTPAARKYGMGK